MGTNFTQIEDYISLPISLTENKRGLYFPLHYEFIYFKQLKAEQWNSAQLYLHNPEIEQPNKLDIPVGGWHCYFLWGNSTCPNILDFSVCK